MSISYRWWITRDGKLSETLFPDVSENQKFPRILMAITNQYY
jgi:hypothetical protein